MSTIITKPAPKAQPAQWVDADNEHEFMERPPINRTFQVVFQAIIQTSRALKNKKVFMHGGLTREEGRKQHDVGIFTGKFGGWACTVNWTTKPRDGLPARHMAVQYKSIPVAVLAPYETWRSKWFTRVISPDILERDAMEVIADKTGKARLFEQLGGDSRDENIANQGRSIGDYKGGKEQKKTDTK